MAAGREWVRRAVAAHPQPARMKVLNLFAYTCAFSVAAKLAGAGQVLNMDMSSAGHGPAEPPAQRREGRCQLCGARHLQQLGQDWSWRALRPDHRRPSQLPEGQLYRHQDYARLIRRLSDLLVPGGHALLCLNAPELGTDFLKAQMTEAAPALQFVQRGQPTAVCRCG